MIEIICALGIFSAIVVALYAVIGIPIQIYKHRKKKRDK
jgi:uncharacterized membrane protein